MIMNSQYLQFAKSLAYDAGKIMLQYFNSELDASYKEDDTIVTVADKEINQLVIDRVHEAFPGHDVYGEEAQDFSNQSQYLWVCDPIDGTAMFARGVPVAVFSLALVIDGKPIIGVVYDPFTDNLYSATEGGGAFCNGVLIHVSNIKLGDNSAVSNFDSSPCYVNEDYHKILKPAVEYLDKTTYQVSIGSIIHAAMLVASGHIVCEITSVSEGKNMDVAAVKVIVEEAGGKVTDIYGNDQRYDRDIKGAVISNGIVHDEIIKTIKESMK